MLGPYSFNFGFQFWLLSEEPGLKRIWLVSSWRASFGNIFGDNSMGDCIGV